MQSKNVTKLFNVLLFMVTCSASTPKDLLSLGVFEIDKKRKITSLLLPNNSKGWAALEIIGEWVIPDRSVSIVGKDGHDSPMYSITAAQAEGFNHLQMPKVYLPLPRSKDESQSAYETRMANHLYSNIPNGFHAKTLDDAKQLFSMDNESLETIEKKFGPIVRVPSVVQLRKLMDPGQLKRELIKTREAIEESERVVHMVSMRRLALFELLNNISESIDESEEEKRAATGDEAKAKPDGDETTAPEAVSETTSASILC